MRPDALRSVAEALRSARHVLVASHVDPDGDAVGSTLGLVLALERAGIGATPVLAHGPAAPSTYAFLPAAKRFVAAAAAPPADVVVAVDSPELSRLGDAEALAREASTLVVIDHHPDGDVPGALSLIDPSAPASGALVWELVPYLDVSPDASVATCLYAALLSDTGRFSYANTTPAALRLAAEMIEAGARPHAIYAAIYETRSRGAQVLLGRTLERIEVANDGLVAWSWISAQDFDETGARPEEAENLIDHVRTLAGVRVVFLAKVLGTTIRVSLRAKADDDVSAVARAFGGGGHRAAAGFTYEGTMPALLAELLPLLPGHR